MPDYRVFCTVLVFCIVFFVSVSPANAWLSGWSHRKKITVTASGTLAHTNDFFVVNVSNVKFGSDNCTKELRLTDASGAEMDFVVLNDDGDALGNGLEWCVIGFNATVPQGVNTDFYAYYGNAGAALPGYADEYLGYGTNWTGGQMVPNDGDGWSHTGASATYGNVSVSEEDYKWHLKMTMGGDSDMVYDGTGAKTNVTAVIRLNTSQAVGKNDFVVYIGDGGVMETLMFSTSRVEYIQKGAGVLGGIEGTKIQTYKITYIESNHTVTVWVYNQTDGGVALVGSTDVTFGVGITYYYVGDPSAAGDTLPTQYIDFMSFDYDNAYPPLSLALGAEEESNPAPVWFNNLTSVASPANFSSAQNYGFQVNWTDVNDTNGYNFSYIEHDFAGAGLVNYTTTRSNNISYYNFTGIPAGTYLFRFYANDSQDLWNKTDQWAYVVDKAPTTINLSTNGTQANTTHIYNQSINVTAWKTVAGGTLSIVRNGTAVSNPFLGMVGAGVHNFTVTLDHANYTAPAVTRFVTMNPGYATKSMNVTPSWSVSEGTQITVTVGSNVSYVLYRNGIVVTSPYTAVLPFGIYNFTLALAEGSNYTDPTMMQWLTVTTGGFGCTNYNIYAFSKTVAGSGLKTLNMTDFVALRYVREDLGDVWVNTSNMTVWKNQTNEQYYLVVNATNATTFVVNFGNYISNLSWTNTTNATGLLVNFTDVQGYTEVYPYYVITSLEETTGAQQLPPGANRTMVLYCSDGISRFDLNHSKILVPTFNQIDQIRVEISYSLTEVYFRSLIVRSETEYKNLYLVDANENQVVQMLIELQDSTGDFGDSVFKVKKNLEGSYETITENYFDAENKVLIYLINGDRYSIYVDNGVEERTIGELYVDSVDLTKTLYLTDIYDMNLSTVGNISYRLYRRNATGYNDAIILNYFDAANQTRNVTMWVYNASDPTQAALHIASSLNHSTVQFTYAVPDVNGSYRVRVHVSHLQFGADSWDWEDVFAAFVGVITAPAALPTIFPLAYVQTLGFIIIMSVPMLFSPPTGATAGVFVVLVAALIAFWNWYPINVAILIFSLALAVLNKMRSRT